MWLKTEHFIYLILLVTSYVTDLDFSVFTCYHLTLYRLYIVVDGTRFERT